MSWSNHMLCMSRCMYLPSTPPPSPFHIDSRVTTIYGSSSAFPNSLLFLLLFDILLCSCSDQFAGSMDSSQLRRLSARKKRTIYTSGNAAQYHAACYECNMGIHCTVCICTMSNIILIINCHTHYQLILLIV